MAQHMTTSDDDDHSLLATSYSTMDSSAEDIKSGLTLLGQVVPPHPAASRAPEETGESCDEDTFSPDPGAAQEGGAGGGKAERKGSKKGSKKGAIKGLKGAAGDDSSTISALSGARGQKKLQGHLTSSLLEEVLNEKKMAMLRSPEVMEQLQFLQEDIRLSRQEQPHGTPTSSSSSVGTKPSKRHQPSDRESGRHKETSSDKHQSQEAGGSGAGGSGAGAGSSSGAGSGGSGSGAGSASSVVWSKEGSAFTSVASTTTPGSSTET